MRLWVIVSLGTCACATTRAVEIAAPLARPPAQVVVEEEATPADAVRAPSSAEGSWVAAFPASKSLTVVEVPSASRVLVHWRIGAGRKVKELPADEDYPGNYLVAIDLVVRARGVEKVVPLGELAGSADPFHLSYCARAGFRLPSAPNLGEPEDPSAASWFAAGTPQGDSDFMLVRDGDVVHVLHRETSDGSCQDAKQGPLDVCEGFEWERFAEIRGTRGAALFERVTDEGKAFDCGADRMGESLTRP